MYKFKMKDDTLMENRIPTMQTWALIQSQIYYDGFCQPLVSDKYYDGVSYELRDLIKEYPDEAAKSRFAYAFHDFDGTTGFDLFSRLEESEANYILWRMSQILNYRKVGDKPVKKLKYTADRLGIPNSQLNIN